MKSRYIEQRELAALTAAAGKTRQSRKAALPLLVALETGLRVGDVVKIRKSDITPDGIVYVAQKTGKPGIAQISPGTRKRLVDNIVETGENWVFPSPTKKGEHITRQAVWARVKRLAAAAGIDARGVSPHSMRKNFAVATYQRSGFAAAQAALQHTHADTTELYALSDFVSGDNARRPLTRGDLDMIAKIVKDMIMSEIRNKDVPA